MKTIAQVTKSMELTNDDFAKFIANIIINDIDNYNFDALYDIARIVEMYKADRAESREPKIDTLHLMIRSTGCDLIDPFDENYKIFSERSTTIYELVFTWNCSYMFNSPFCKVTELDK